MDVKVTVWEAESKFKPKTPSEVIADWCEATAGRIEPEFGTAKAMGYLIGEKFLNVLEAAESSNEWREAIPEFVGAIKSLFEPWQLAQFLKTPRGWERSATSPVRRRTGCFVRPWMSPSEFERTPGT